MWAHFGMTANPFGVARSTVSVIVSQICKALTFYVGPKYISLPKTEEEMRELVVKIESRHGFPQAFVCVDGTHIPIQQSLGNPQDSYLYKMKYTLNMPGICDFEGEFIDADRRWPGSVHAYGAKVFSNSRINFMFRDGILPLLHRLLLPGVDKVPVLLLGDSA